VDDGVNRCEGVAQQGILYRGCWRARQWRKSLQSQIHTCVEMSRRFKHCLALYQVRSNAALLMVLTAIILRSDQDSRLLARRCSRRADWTCTCCKSAAAVPLVRRSLWQLCVVELGIRNVVTFATLLRLRTPRNNLARIPDTSTTSHSVSTSNHAQQPRFKSYYTLASSHQ
jgi:hypothetical protein